MFEDQVLKWKFKRGSDEALTLIYEKYLNSMLTLAMGLLNDAAAAEDVVQDVFVSFAQSRRKQERRSKFPCGRGIRTSSVSMTQAPSA